MRRIWHSIIRPWNLENGGRILRHVLFFRSALALVARVPSERSPRTIETSTPKTARSSGGAKVHRSGDRPDRSRSPVKKEKDRARASPAKSSQDGEIGSHNNVCEDPAMLSKYRIFEYFFAAWNAP